MVDADDELGVGYGHGVLVCGSFTTAGDARLMLEEKINPDLKKPKAERVFQEAVDPELRKKQDEADVDFESDANPDFNINDFGSVGPDDSVLADADADEMDEAADATNRRMRKRLRKTKRSDEAKQHRTMTPYVRRTPSI